MGRKRSGRVALVLCAAAVAMSQVWAAEADVVGQLGEGLKAAATFKYGDSDAAPRKVEDLVIEAAKDPKLRVEAEKLLIATLTATDTSPAYKGLLCRHLRIMGSAACVPALAALLTDEKLSHMARYALGYMEYPEAGAALREAVGKTSGALKVGMLGSLGNRRDEKAVPDLVKLVGDKDALVSEAAIAALGRIGGADAATALEAARAGAKDKLRAVVGDSLLQCADRLLAAGDLERAAKMFQPLYGPDEARHVRIAALRGMVVATGEKALPIVIELMKGNDPELRANAIRFVRDFKGEAATKRFAAELPTLPADTQVLLIAALADRADAAAKPPILAATKSDDEAVRAAALEALGQVGDASVVPLLAEAAATGKGKDRDAARASLINLSGEGVDAAIAKAMESAEGKTRAELIRTLAERKATGVTDAILKAASDADNDIRREAIRALGVLAGEEQLAALVGRMVQPKEAGDRPAIEKSVMAVCVRIEDKGKQEAPVLAALGGATGEAKAALLRVLGKTASAKALAAVRAGMKDRDPAVHDAAFRSLADWPDAAPLDEVMKLVRTSADQVHKVLALRGAVRMINLPSERDTDETLDLYKQALDLAQRPEERKLVLAGLANATSPEAIRVVEPFLDNPALRDEGIQTMLAIAKTLSATHKPEAIAALRSVIGVARDKRLRDDAKRMIDDMEKYEGFILAWEGSGPYTEQGKTGEQLFDAVLPPEKPDAKDVKWGRVTKGVEGLQINLEQAFGSVTNAAAYLRASVYSPIEQMAELQIGSDDGVKVWLNDKVVHAKNVVRGLKPADDRVRVSLREGWNPIMLKVVQVEGQWSVCLRVRDTADVSLVGLRMLPGIQR